MHIYQFEYHDLTIELTYNKGHLAWAFTYYGKNYGASIAAESKKVIDIASVSAQLLLNAIATYEDLRLRPGA